MEHQFLYSKIDKLTDKESFLRGGGGVGCAEFLEQPSGTATFAEDHSVQAYISPAIAISFHGLELKTTEDRIGSLSDTHRLCIAEVRKRGLEDAVIVKHLNAPVAAIASVDDALSIQRNTQNIGEFAGSCASFYPQDFTDLPSLSKLAMRALPPPSATKDILPSASEATWWAD